MEEEEDDDEGEEGVEDKQMKLIGKRETNEWSIESQVTIEQSSRSGIRLCEFDVRES